MERKISAHVSSSNPERAKQIRLIGAHAANPLTRSVLPDFVEQLSQSTSFDFQIKGFASQADLIRALRAREVHFAVMLPPKRGHVDKPSIGMAPFSPQRAVVCIYAMRFAMISFRQTGLTSLGDLVGQRVATGFGPNSLVDEYLDAFLRDHVGGRENISPVPCENIADAMQRLRAREIAATPFPLDGIKITSLARGLVRPLEGMLSRATVQKITHDHPGLRVRCTELFGNRNVTMIETPIIVYAAQDMADREVHAMIAAAKDFFRFYIKHRYGKMPPAGFFDPKPLGLMTHPASVAHFGHSQGGALH
ncbi:hypothetical protein HPQ64_09320 [Rhizobiales bacterium]|uniref:hypothetical protein n=1 Tax=Hongsoonwoonella zoysiae TaxID=2821844 RepID=UPI00155FEC24|nr:hypothetical protein [Hongsoonwoonella zoysiae]NRG17887.1 hypothetical protein [Hongsoonwoonella zoysiae]